MADFYLNWSTWDAEVTGGKIREINIDGTDGIEEMKQRIAIAIKTHRGECFFNTDLGLPWTTEILVKAPNLTRITALARRYLLSIEGVEGVRKLELSFNAQTSVMTWDLDIETSAGVTGPFKVLS
jgi:hypothetical protein